MSAPTFPHDAVSPLQADLRNELSSCEAGDLLVAAGAQALMSLAVAGVAEVHQPGGKPLPLTSYSTVQTECIDDGMQYLQQLMVPVQEWSQRQTQEHQRDHRDYLARRAIWDERGKDIRQRIRKAVKAGEDTAGLQKELAEIQAQEPVAPADHTLLFTDFTKQGAWRSGAGLLPALRWAADEGVNPLSALSPKDYPVLASQWNGVPIPHGRVGEAHQGIHRRSSIFLVVKPGTYFNFCKQHGKSFKERGLGARFQYSHVSSGRPISSSAVAAGSGPAYQKYVSHMTAHLDDMALRVKNGSGLKPVHLSPRASRTWEDCHYHYFEAMHRPGNQHCRDFLARMPEHIARMAARNHVFEGLEGDISPWEVECAEEIMRYHLDVYAWLHEPKPPAPTKGQLQLWDDAEALCAWLWRHPDQCFPNTQNRHVADMLCMTVARLRKAIVLLKEDGIVRVTEGGGKVVVRLRPEEHLRVGSL